jgi:tol-pal system protein YbgF
LTAAAFAALLAIVSQPALAQERGSGNFLDKLLNRGEQAQPPAQPAQPGRVAQSDSADPADLTVRLDRLENALRQLTGTIEQLQYRNQQLEMQLKRMQDDTEFRFQQLGAKPGPARAGQLNGQIAPAAPAAPATSGRRSDVFDPSQHPGAPGAPRTLGTGTAMTTPAQDDAPVGAPNGRAAGAPLDLSTLSANPPPPAASAPVASQPNAEAAAAAPAAAPERNAQQPPRNVAGTHLATLPPSAKPQDEYDLAYGYVLHKDYALAEQAFRDFMRKYPNERLVPDAQYWLGESLYQRQRYRDAAEAFLAVSTKYENSGKAPDSLLRLGQSLAALDQKEAACATLTEVGRKYPKASGSVKRGVAQEIKRAHC